MPQTLEQSVHEALQVYSPLRTSRANIDVRVEDRKVILSGYVPSASTKRMAAVLACSVDGVSEFVNDLLADPELEQWVALALAADERTRPWPIRVRAKLGYVQLQGYVPDEETVKTALEVARRVKGPKQIVNALKVRQDLQVAA